MRTTLKRGIGRGAAVNGNGRAVLPPDARPALTLYRQPEPARRGTSLLVRILLWVLASLLMVGAGLLGGAYLYFHEKVAQIQEVTPEVQLAQQKLAVPPLPGRPAVAIVIGYDHRAGVEKDEIPRSDTIMLLRADPGTRSVSMLSFPRDLLVDIHCPKRPVFQDRINVAYSECGPTGTVETVKALTNVPINYIVTVDFHAFKQIVDKLGGVWIDVDRRYFNDNRGLTPGFNTYATIDIHPGYQKLRGADALDFVRYRHTDSDLVRVVRQQLFVKAVKEQVSQSISPWKLPKIVNAITTNVQLGQGGKGEIDPKTILSYAFFGYKLPAGHFFQSRIENLQPAGPFNAELAGSETDIANAVRDFVSPDVEAADKAAAVNIGRKPPKTAQGPRPQDTTVTVLNGNGVTGSAANAAYELTKRGYEILVSPNTADRNVSPDYFRTKVYFDPRQPLSKPAATKIRNLFGDADLEPLPADIRALSNSALVVVIVGETFHNTLAPAPEDKTPKKEPPHVSNNPAATSDLLRDARKRVPFRLELPHVIEETSAPESQEPIRVYRIAKGHKAVRLTFRTSGDANEYWGIEETDWEDAPILAQPSFTHRIKGRRFDLYYNGPKLHMIVLRENGATYWVVNTLLDTLSNETMLAIAKGLKPMPGRVPAR